MKYSKLLLSGVLLSLVFAVASCSKRQDVVLAEVGDRTITVGEFERVYEKVTPDFLPKQTGLAGKREFLQTMIHKEVLAYKADELGYDKDPGVIQGMQQFRGLGLQIAYLKTRVSDLINVTEDDIQLHYSRLGSTIGMKQIVVDTPAEAEQVHGMLVDGADFESVCREYSRGPDAQQGGILMTVQYGRLTPELQDELFSLKVGDISKPIETAYGYFIMKVLSRDAAKIKEPLEQVREKIVEDLTNLQQMVINKQVTDKIREDAGVEWFYDGLRIAFEALPPDRDFSNAPRRQDEVYPLLYFDVEDLEKPVVTYKGKILTISDFSDLYDQASFFKRPRRDFRLMGVRNFMTEVLMGELLEDELARSNIAENEDVRRVMKNKEEELMVGRLYEEMVNSNTVITAKAMRDYYDEHIDIFRVPEKRTFGVILTNSQDEALKAYNDLKDGALFRTVALAYSIDSSVRQNLGETGQLSEGEQPELDPVGFSLPRVGAFSEPFQTARGWMILKLVEVVAERTFTFDEAQGQIQTGLKQMANEDRLEELLTKWIDEIGVVVHEDRLDKIQIVERSASEESAAPTF